MTIPRLVIAGTASNVGKTTVTVGLTLALRARGYRVRVFKCGPDYLDPTYHQRASEAPCHNLDGWLMGREAVIATFNHACQDADVALIEGVMGLFDGAAADSEAGSSAEIAKWLQAPVVLVCDASGMARSIAALAHGFGSFDPDLQLAGLVCNRLGSRGHLDLLRKATRGVATVLGGLPKEKQGSFPERHLGLQTASSEAVPRALLDVWGGRVEEWCDVAGILELARSAPALPEVSVVAGCVATARCRIGIAQDKAFHFYYDDNLRRLEALGAELVPFSPLDAVRLPAVDGLYLGGGYPELHAAELAANRSLMSDIVAFAAAQGPIYAECGGLMYLSNGIRTLDGQFYPMLGLIAGVAEMRAQIQALGYVEVETQTTTLFGEAGLRFRGHQFRYSEFQLRSESSVACAYSVRRRRGGEVSREGYGNGNTLASYVHAHWASNPRIAQGFVAACSEQRRRASRAC